jgi:hypothetical protein
LALLLNTVIKHPYKFLKCVFVAFSLSIGTLQAQILQDTASFSLIKKGIDYIYNYRFDEAIEVYNKLSQSYPGHPVGYLFRGIITYWKNYPLLPSSPEKVNYESDMRKCIELCEARHNASDETELLLADLCARGMLLLFYADNDLSMEVFPLATSTYPYLMHSFNFTSIYNDFYFFTGLYNYYREAYPDAYPVYKTFAFIFPKGDKVKGLKELQNAAKNSIVLKAESASFLSLIYLSFENNYNEASQYSRYLYKLYPDNIQYLASYIKSLLLIKQYDEAERLIIKSVNKTDNPYFKAQLVIFHGILQEKKYFNTESAQQDYTNGVKSMSQFGEFGNEYTAYAYFGLSRIYGIKGDTKNRKIFRKKALEKADFKKIDFD